MKRRHFLKTTVVVASPILDACSSGDDDPAQSPDAGGGDAGSVRVDESRYPQSVASGDPRPESVVLWTRFDGRAQESVELLLEMALDEDFERRVKLGNEDQLVVLAERRWDHCVRVRVDGLSADTHYYYRFVHILEDERIASRTGRTKTAPDADADRKVTFAVMSCQDYGGRYYHAHRHASNQQLDFVVHLGDYIYETAGDPRFQQEDEDRSIVFRDVEGAVMLAANNDVPGSEEPTTGSFLAAGSVDNYRQLYQTVRSDRDLQRLHERYPMICVWDDHEFSNDCYGQNATYSSGQEDEFEPERRANADQAWFEYMPVDYDDARFEFDRDGDFPDNLQIYRDFRFGRHVHLVMTDLRRFRADHIIPEDAVPASVAVTQERLLELLGEVPDSAEAYVDIDELEGGAYLDALKSAADDGVEFDVDVSRLSGPTSVPMLNALLEVHNAAVDGENLEPVDPDDASLPRGISFAQAGKTADYSSFGSRLFPEPNAFELIAKDRFDATDGDSEQVMGAAQERWFISTLEESNATWKIWGNSYTLATRSLDLTSLTLPNGLSRVFRLSTDDWDGFPNKRKELLDALDGIDGIVAVTGDSHSFFASTTGIDDPAGVIEFVCGAISSATYQAVIQSGIDGIPGLDLLAPLAGPLIEQANPHIAYQNVADNGFAVVDADGDALLVRFFELGLGRVHEKELDGELDDNFAVREFRVLYGSRQIEQRIEDEFKIWDEESQSYI